MGTTSGLSEERRTQLKALIEAQAKRSGDSTATPSAIPSDTEQRRTQLQTLVGQSGGHQGTKSASTPAPSQSSKPSQPASAPTSKAEVSDEELRSAAIRAAHARAEQQAEEEQVPASSKPEQPKPTPKAAATPEKRSASTEGAGMSDDKAARLAAVREANAKKKAASGASPEAPSKKSESATGQSDDKAARLAAIREANAKKQAGGEGAAAAPAAKPAAAKAAEKPAAAAKPKPAAKKSATDDIPSLTTKGLIMRLVVGAILGAIMFVAFQTTTVHFTSQMAAGITGAALGAFSGYLFGLWPPYAGDETTE